MRQAEPARNVVLVDLDNTVFNLMKGLEKEFDWVETDKQLHYSFTEVYGEKAKDIYAKFREVNFYTGLGTIDQVETELERLVEQGYELVFYSNKPDIVHGLYEHWFSLWLSTRSYLKRSTKLHLWSTDKELDIVIGKYRERLVKVIDDHPSKLFYKVTGVEYKVPAWPYNKELQVPDCSRLSYIDLTGTK